MLDYFVILFPHDLLGFYLYIIIIIIIIIIVLNKKYIIKEKAGRFILPLIKNTKNMLGIIFI